MDRWQLRLRRRRARHWCGWTNLRCDLEQVGKTARPYQYTSATQKRMLRHLLQVPRLGHNQVWTDHTGTRYLDALQEDVVFCEDGETTIARDGAIAMSGVFLHHRRWSGHDRGRKRSATDIIAGTTSLPTPWVPGRPRGSQFCAEVPIFLLSQTRCRRQDAGTAYEALESSTAEIAHEVCKMPQTWTLGSRVSRRESRTTQRRKVRPTCGETW